MTDVSSPNIRRQWFDQGLADGKTHMLVVTDTFDYSDYPVYVPADIDGQMVADPQAVYDHYHGRNMQKVMECFDLSLPRDDQIDAPHMVHNGVSRDQRPVNAERVEEISSALKGFMRATGGLPSRP